MTSLWGAEIPPRGSAYVAETTVFVSCQELDAYSDAQIEALIRLRAEQAACRLRAAVRERREAIH